MIGFQGTSRLPRANMRTRIGAVSYLNSKPLIEGLPGLCPDAELTLDLPSSLADDLAQGLLDVALIPSVEAFSHPDYEIVSDACVATHGPVLSVKLYFRTPPGEVKTLALDVGSRTSAALSRIMLSERFGVEPVLERLPLGKSLADSKADATLLIGDRAMFPPDGEYRSCWDLGEEWVEWTGLPFVFAMWTGRRSDGLSEIEAGLTAARDLGVSRIDDIARAGAQALQLPLELTRTYLSQHLHFQLGPAERAGLQLFHELAVQHGFAGDWDLTFSSRQPVCC